MSVEIKQCVMCNKDFPAGELDYLGRCGDCFEVYKNLPNDEKPNLGVPFTPGYNSTWKK